ncbi:hypothetical protein MPSEU_000477500 [Mayamaea pseudoterrestris]|nr:hypothetical protein MPSEU_000477500 [Mayamaea pseudoterrestris]
MWENHRQLPLFQRIIIIGLPFFALPHSVQAWGKEGHQIVANLAWDLISNDTQTKLYDIIASSSYGIDKDCNDKCSPLAQVADWADTARYSSTYSWTGPLHYLNVNQKPCPITNSLQKTDVCYFDYARDCSDNLCVPGAIFNNTQIIMRMNNVVDVAPDDFLQRTSLMFLVHFVGDIHQPLHCSRLADLGGNTIHVDFEGDSDDDYYDYQARHRRQSQEAVMDSRRFLRKQGNLHSFWDSFMIEKSMRDNFGGSRVALEDALWERLQQASEDEWAQWLDCADGSSLECTDAWGQESLEYALMYAYRNVNDTEIVDGTMLSQDYYVSRVEVVWQRLMVASVRLASTLEVAMQGATSLSAKPIGGFGDDVPLAADKGDVSSGRANNWLRMKWLIFLLMTAAIFTF